MDNDGLLNFGLFGVGQFSVESTQGAVAMSQIEVAILKARFARLFVFCKQL
jgi:hypothetical protein